MNGHIIDKYKDKKIKVLIYYAKILETLITLEDNTLWKNAHEFQIINEGVTNIFASKYYFDNNINRHEAIEYLNDNINAVLLAIIEYYKKLNQPNIIKEKKNETFLLSVIICSASFVDIASNSIDGNFGLMKSNLKKLLKYLNDTGLLKVYWQNKIILNNLFKLVKENLNNERKFFDLFNSSKYYNEYQIVSTKPLLYKVKFIYKVENIADQDTNIIKKYQHLYLKKYLEISYELLAIQLMKEYIMNKMVNTYLVPLVKDSKLECLDYPLIKDNIRLLVPLEEINSFQNTYNFKIIYYYNGDDEKELLKYDKIDVLVKSKLYQKLNINDLKINVIEEKIGNSYLENDICKKEEE